MVVLSLRRMVLVGGVVVAVVVVVVDCGCCWTGAVGAVFKGTQVPRVGRERMTSLFSLDVFM